MTNLLILIVGAVLNLGLGLVVLVKSRNFIIRISFFLLTLSLIFWSVCNYFSVSFDTEYLTLIFMRLVMFFAVLQVVFFLFFSMAFPEGKLLIKSSRLIPYIILVLLTLLVTLSPYMFSSVKIDLTNGTRSPSVDKGMLLFVITAVGSLIYGFVVLIKKYIKAVGFTKDQLKFLFIGVALMFLLMLVFNLILVLVFKMDSFVWLGTYFTLPFVAFTAYAIVTKGLFDIKVILTEAAVVLLCLISFIEVITSNTLSEGSLRGAFFLIVLYGSSLLVQSVKKEIRQREEVQKLAEELKMSNKEVKQANDALKRLDKAKDEFISVASHELNTPLAAIEGYLSMILDEHMAKVDAKATQFLTRAYQSSKRLAALIMDLLNVSRIEQGRIHLQYVETDICDLVDEVVGELKIKADEKKIGLEFACPKDKPPKTWIDGARIHEVITNLTGNAIKFTDKGKVTLTVTADDKNIRVAVKDSGIGIDKDDVEKLFHKFSQVDRMENERQGTGLGLYISKSYVDMHNGKIWAESEGEGKGTTMLFELPILDKKPHDENEGEGAVIRSAPNDEVMQQVMAVSKAHEIKE